MKNNHYSQLLQAWKKSSLHQTLRKNTGTPPKKGNQETGTKEGEGFCEVGLFGRHIWGGARRERTQRDNKEDSAKLTPRHNV